MQSTETKLNTSSPKSGADHIESLKDNRTIYINGEAIQDVTSHSAFKQSVASSARLYDMQCAPEHVDQLTFKSPTSNGLVNIMWQLPTSYEELVKRREGLYTMAESHAGFMGRSPDHLASALGGQVMGLNVFEEYSPEYANNLSNYYQYIRDNDLALTYVIINPQNGRVEGANGLEDDMTMRVVAEDEDGITVRGAKMLGTSGIMANEVFVASLQPLRPGQELNATSFALPMDTEGLRILSRKSYEQNAVSMFDNPISSQFDENDALIYFDDVKVPRNRLFVNQDIDMCRKQFHDTPGHVFQNYQSQIRLTVKLKFLLGVAYKITETIGTVNMPPVKATLGKLASEVTTVEALLKGMEVDGSHFGDYFVPNKHMLYSAQVYTQELYPAFVNTIRDLAGGSLIMLPSSVRDFDNPVMLDVINKTQITDGVTPRDRVKFLKLAWDVLGSEYAGRHQQYEMFYAGAQFVTRGHSHRSFDWNSVKGMVDDMLASYN